MERTYSAEETAQILGLCLDSVRRHFRAGKLPGVRVGRSWRIAESQLKEYLGVAATSAPTKAADVFQPQGSPMQKDEVIAPLLRTAPVRAQIQELVQQAAVNAKLSPKKTEYLLHDLDVLLRQN